MAANIKALLVAAAAAFIVAARASKSKTSPSPQLGDGGEVANHSEIIKHIATDVPRLGMLYQTKFGDNSLIVARKALFGSAAQRSSISERAAAEELSIRMDCGPWNQTVNGRHKDEILPGHPAIDRGISDIGIYYMDDFPDNLERLSSGLPPIVGIRGDRYPLVYVPWIDEALFLSSGAVSLAGQNWAYDGSSYSKIDPPPEIISLGFVGEIDSEEVGCRLSDGDFRKIIQSN